MKMGEKGIPDRGKMQRDVKERGLRELRTSFSWNVRDMEDGRTGNGSPNTMSASLHFILQVREPIQGFRKGNDKTYFCLGQITNHEWDMGLRRSKVYSVTPVSIINCLLQMRNDKGLN